MTSCDLCADHLLILSHCMVLISLLSSFPFPLSFIGAETVRFKAEINVDGREITRMYLSKMDLEALLKVS